MDRINLNINGTKCWFDTEEAKTYDRFMLKNKIMVLNGGASPNITKEQREQLSIATEKWLIENYDNK